VREGICILLEMIGYEVTAVDSGEAAVALVLDQAPDFLLSDVSLAGMAGPEVARVLRQRWPLITVVLMSGYVEESMRTNAAREGWHFLQKPFELPDLARELRMATDAHHRC
jgi:CheY-like chemotaxis protein